ncbi:hypothetical protein Pcinc_039219 [Petrolisthes cinctipes]|uniref:Uncharacterized protein n=1 Tax=Petrolisthes cinctipes TaxID=88211 RepID=A0AAE1BST7_PETCI|nr:hypothetical protein Pcinc_039219 [Petrolisthes cinctipes]
MTRGLLLCLNRAGYRPVIASRNPRRTRTWLSGGGGEFDVAGVEEGITMGHPNTIPFQAGPSLAGAACRSLNYPGAHVLKAYNTVSAYVMQRGDLHRGREVPICGNEVRARAKVCQLVKGMGLEAVDMGNPHQRSSHRKHTPLILPHLENTPHCVNPGFSLLLAYDNFSQPNLPQH